MGKQVLLVDDDRLPMRFYVRALEKSGFNVKHCLEPDSALSFVEDCKTGQQTIDVVILDIMMPPGKTYSSKDTNQGLTTGVLLLKRIKELLPNVPVVVLTNVRNPETIDKIKQFEVEVLEKTKSPAFELARHLREIVDN